MKPEGAFVAERALAEHSDRLVRRRGEAPGGGEAAVVGFAARLAGELRGALRTLLAEASPRVLAGPVSTGPIAPAPGEGLSASFRFASASGDAAVRAAIDGRAVLALVERSFGGAGTMTGALPGEFPPSAQLLIVRLEGLLAGALNRALGLAESGALQPLPKPGAFAAGPAHETGARFVLTIGETGHEPWDIAVAIPASALAPLFGGSGADGTGRARLPRSADPAAAPWGDIALPLRALLVDMTVALSLVARFEPGQVIPVSVARQVPLHLGDRLLGHGSVGALDDRVALQLARPA